MVRISLLTENDRAEWEALIRAKEAHFDTEHSDEDYDRAWGRLLDGAPRRGIAARLDGKMVGIAHYLFHDSIWYSGKCYLVDLFVDPGVRRRGVATTIIHWVAADAVEHGFPALYWNTLEDAEARALYDKVGRQLDGFVYYNYRRTTA
ncbi:GNAT family N-acetyltransferase [Actinokineospora pegani]|uniref:GNAT family N-acetyltransferase n=1 Tax=Actinokineospora pegani TaxID=2654637 RepID=UPI001F45BD4D|nr:GNAT family N-acetyltransferase [Actinokineospora pegani]